MVFTPFKVDSRRRDRIDHEELAVLVDWRGGKSGAGAPHSIFHIAMPDGESRSQVGMCGAESKIRTLRKLRRRTQELGEEVHSRQLKVES